MDCTYVALHDGRGPTDQRRALRMLMRHGTPARRYLAELEMKLQLLSEDVEAALADSSSRALQRIPVAVQEVSRIKAGSRDARR